MILSACETARPGIRLPDEVVGLPGALLQAGAGGVLATWWPVPDDLALLAMLAFYERWTVPSAEATPTASPVIALAQAQRWLRDSSNGQVRAYLEGLLDDSGNWVPQAMLEHVWENVVLQDPQAFPYSKPATWGAFGYYGP